MSVVAACLPVLGPLYKSAKSPASMMRNLWSSLSLQSLSLRKTVREDATTNENIELDNKDSRSAWLRLTSNDGPKSDISYDPVMYQGDIRVGQPTAHGILVHESLESKVSRAESESWKD